MSPVDDGIVTNPGDILTLKLLAAATALAIGVIMIYPTSVTIKNLKSRRVYFMGWIYRERDPAQYWVFALGLYGCLLLPAGVFALIESIVFFRSAFSLE